MNNAELGVFEEERGGCGGRSILKIFLEEQWHIRITLFSVQSRAENTSRKFEFERMFCRIYTIRYENRVDFKYLSYLLILPYLLFLKSVLNKNRECISQRYALSKP